MEARRSVRAVSRIWTARGKSPDTLVLASRWTSATSNFEAISSSALGMSWASSNRPFPSRSPRVRIFFWKTSRFRTGRESGVAPGFPMRSPVSREVGAATPKVALTCFAAKISARLSLWIVPAATVTSNIRTVAPCGVRGSSDAKHMFIETSIPRLRHTDTMRSASTRRPHCSRAAVDGRPKPFRSRRKAAESRVRQWPSSSSAGAKVQRCT